MVESERARRAWLDYLALGPGRSLDKLLVLYQSQPKSSPTRLMSTLKLWSRSFGWQARLQEISEKEMAAAAARETEALAVLQSTGIGNRRIRLELLDQKTRKLEQVIAERAADPSMTGVPGGATGLLTRQYKQIGVGRNAEAVEEYVVDVGTLKEIRETLKQAAQELGQWIEKQDNTFHGKPLVFTLKLADHPLGTPDPLPETG